MIDGVARCGRQVTLVEKIVDEIAVTFLGGNASSGSVWLAQIAQLGKRVEFRAHGCRADFEIVIAN